MNKSQKLLKLAGILSFSVALFQTVVTLVPDWARYFGAWDAVASNVWLLYLTGFFAAFIFALWGLYALSGAGYIRPLPLLRTALISIGTVFTLRGLFLVLELLINAGVVKGTMIIPARELAASSVSLTIGILYIAGTIGYWSKIPAKRDTVAAIQP